jgi:glycine/D-amino acid oxidase-like deaminating enzyme
MSGRRVALAPAQGPLPLGQTALSTMPQATIIGAGVLGLSIANSLPAHYDVAVVARDLPGDEPSLDWASPWCVHDRLSPPKSPPITAYTTDLPPERDLTKMLGQARASGWARRQTP